MKQLSVRYETGLKEDLQDPEEAAAYLSAALEDKSQDVFLLALRDVVEARGVSKIADKAGFNRENLYRILSGRGNPQPSSLNALLETLGIKLAFTARLFSRYQSNCGNRSNDWEPSCKTMSSTDRSLLAEGFLFSQNGGNHLCRTDWQFCFR